MASHMAEMDTSHFPLIPPFDAAHFNQASMQNQPIPASIFVHVV
jgi:hypothetical protein